MRWLVKLLRPRCSPVFSEIDIKIRLSLVRSGDGVGVIIATVSILRLLSVVAYRVWVLTSGLGVDLVLDLLLLLLI